MSLEVAPCMPAFVITIVELYVHLEALWMISCLSCLDLHLQLTSPLHVLAAVNKAVVQKEQLQTKTKNIYSEIIYNLSQSTNVREELLPLVCLVHHIK